MQRPEYYLGIDIASASFFAAIGKAENEQWHLLGKPRDFQNEYDSLSQFLNWMQEHQLKPGNTIICMEATGVYNEVLAHFLVANGYALAIQSPLEVKRAFKPVGHKSDPVIANKLPNMPIAFSMNYAYGSPVKMFWSRSRPSWPRVSSSASRKLLT